MQDDLDSVPRHALAQQLAALSASEMVAALGVRAGPAFLRKGLELPFHAASRLLGQTLAELDGDVATRGLPEAAARALERFGVDLRVNGAAPATGPLLVLANHPGAYDALSLMSALRREDLSILAADRRFLRALPRLSAHFSFVGDGVSKRSGALRHAVRHLRNGGGLLHFPAGQIEPDADFEPDRARWLEPWQPGVSVLVEACARVDGSVLVAGVRGVHSPRAKRWLLNRAAERRGITTLSPLLQMLAKLRDVITRVSVFDVGRARGLSGLSSAEQQTQLREALRVALETDGR